MTIYPHDVTLERVNYQLALPWQAESTTRLVKGPAQLLLFSGHFLLFFINNYSCMQRSIAKQHHILVQCTSAGHLPKPSTVLTPLI